MTLIRFDQSVFDSYRDGCFTQNRVVLADGGGGFGGFDDLFGDHKSGVLIQPKAAADNKAKHFCQTVPQLNLPKLT